MINIYTLGFNKKSAEYFFSTLEKFEIKKLYDIRLNVKSQLLGFTKGQDLKYFTKKILKIDYIHYLDFAPTQEILDNYKNKGITWEKYEDEYINMLETRNVIKKIEIKEFDNVCFLCSEEKADKCHRRLLVEFLQKKYPAENIKIIHL